ncbi:MAG: hypothetical protein ACPGQL_09735 [Thermoplasmatota archaeon]
MERPKKQAIWTVGHPYFRSPHSSPVGDSERIALPAVVQSSRWVSFWNGVKQGAARVWTEAVVPAAQAIGREALHWSETYHRSTTVSAGLQRLGWPPVHYEHQALHMELEHLFRNAPDDIELQVVRAIHRYMDETGLERMQSDWKSNPLLQSRFAILDDTVQCHRQELWNASLPVWYILVEGILNENIAPNKPRRTPRGQRTIGPLDCFRLITTPHLPFKGWQAIQEFTQKQAWCQYLSSSDSVSNSRHGVMHGASTDYGTPENSLKALLLFDYVQEVLHYGIIVQEETLHRPGCSLLTAHPSDLAFFQNELWASIVGKVMHLPRCAQCYQEESQPRTSPRPLRLLENRYPNRKRLAADNPTLPIPASPDLAIPPGGKQNP